MRTFESSKMPAGRSKTKKMKTRNMRKRLPEAPPSFRPSVTRNANPLAEPAESNGRVRESMSKRTDPNRIDRGRSKLSRTVSLFWTIPERVYAATRGKAVPPQDSCKHSFQRNHRSAIAPRSKSTRNPWTFVAIEKVH